jgi:hypothetical protein
MLREKLAQQPLVRARIGIAEWKTGVTSEKTAQRITRLRR